MFLPIYHGTEENVLQTSIGHLEESSLPVGGESAHSMLSGHRGLPSARLFTDLDKLGEGDTFTMTIPQKNPDGSLVYDVDAAAKPLRVAKEELPPPPTPPHNIPQTGQLWWPVMMLGGLGVLVLFIGMTRKNRTK